MTASSDPDVLVVGAGAAGLATAIVAARTWPGLRVECLDGARRLGAKILVSGGSRCNVTNRHVTERDYWGGSARSIRAVLRAWPVAQTVRFFEDLGVTLHEEDDGKLFPDSHRARTVLDALLAEAGRHGVTLSTNARVTSVACDAPSGFVVGLADGGARRAPCVVLATGGRSLPKSGSDGAGYAWAEALGHRIVPTTPALVPLVLDGDRHAGLAGRAHPALLTLESSGAPPIRVSGALLWTHFGVSGPAALDLSRHWHRARVEGRDARVWLALLPGATEAALDAWLVEQSRERPKALVATVLATRLPAAVADRWTAETGLTGATLAHLPRDRRRVLVEALLRTRLDVRDSRGYQYAEVTAGGVALDEVSPGTLESRRCAGLYFAGEILDVDGRLGGFNFQWAWASGFVAGTAVARAARTERRA